MSKQPEALRLADSLEHDLLERNGSRLSIYMQEIADSSAAELRRLHALNVELLAMLKESVKPLHLYRAYGWSDRLRVIDRVEALVARAEAA